MKIERFHSRWKRSNVENGGMGLPNSLVKTAASSSATPSLMRPLRVMCYMETIHGSIGLVLVVAVVVMVQPETAAIF
jgi:hypothetical protein